MTYPQSDLTGLAVDEVGMRKTPIAIVGGWLDGRFIRRARKTFRCGYFRGRSGGGMCNKKIKPGDLYAEGECSPYVAGGFGCDRYCLECAGPEAVASAAALSHAAQG